MQDNWTKSIQLTPPTRASPLLHFEEQGLKKVHERRGSNSGPNATPVIGVQSMAILFLWSAEVRNAACAVWIMWGSAISVTGYVRACVWKVARDDDVSDSHGSQSTRLPSHRRPACTRALNARSRACFPLNHAQLLASTLECACVCERTKTEWEEQRQESERLEKSVEPKGWLFPGSAAKKIHQSTALPFASIASRLQWLDYEWVSSEFYDEAIKICVQI